jgi:hypothetical protein
MIKTRRQTIDMYYIIIYISHKMDYPYDNMNGIGDTNHDNTSNKNAQNTHTQTQNLVRYEKNRESEREGGGEKSG